MPRKKKSLSEYRSTNRDIVPHRLSHLSIILYSQPLIDDYMQIVTSQKLMLYFVPEEIFLLAWASSVSSRIAASISSWPVRNTRMSPAGS